MGKPTETKREAREYHCEYCGKRAASKYAIKQHKVICVENRYGGGY